MSQTTISAEARSLAQRYLSRRQMLGGTLAAGALLAFTGFRKTKEIEAYNERAAQANQPTLFDQLGGLLGISLVIQDFVNIVANDNRINSFFAGTVANGRVPHLEEKLIEQVANATGGPVQYTGLDMKTAHAGMGITTSAFNALVEDLAQALKDQGVSDDAAMMLLGALAPLKDQIVEIPDQ